MYLNLISDLHLDTRTGEHWLAEIPQILPSNPRQGRGQGLVIAGDLSSCTAPRYRDYLSALARGYEQTLYVPGNHEFYSAPGSLPDTLDYIERVCKFLPEPVLILRAGAPGYDLPRFVDEDEEVVNLPPPTRVLGATCWTDVPEDMSPELAKQTLNDYNFVPGLDSGRSPIRLAEVGALHRMDVRWLKDSVDEAADQGFRALVVTHHSPDRRLSVLNRSRAGGGLGPFYYASDMGSLLTRPNIVGWFHGHTHDARVTKLRDCDFPFLTNAYGYPGESTGFARGAGVIV